MLGNMLMTKIPAHTNILLLKQNLFEGEGSKIFTSKYHFMINGCYLKGLSREGVSNIFLLLMESRLCNTGGEGNQPNWGPMCTWEMWPKASDFLVNISRNPFRIWTQICEVCTAFCTWRCFSVWWEIQKKPKVLLHFQKLLPENWPPPPV